jgi:hypothetical protein
MEPANETVEAYTRVYLADLALWKDVVTRAKNSDDGLILLGGRRRASVRSWLAPV